MSGVRCFTVYLSPMIDLCVCVSAYLGAVVLQNPSIIIIS